MGFLKSLDDGQVGGEAIKAVEGAWNEHCFTFDAAGLQFLGVGGIFIVKNIQRPHPDPGGRQPREVGTARRRRIIGHILCPAVFSKIRLPPKAIIFMRPGHVIAVINLGAQDSPVIQHRVDQ